MQQELRCLVPQRDFGRRDFVRAAVGDSKMPAYRAAPLNRRHAPVVRVVSQVFGVHAYIADGFKTHGVA